MLSKVILFVQKRSSPLSSPGRKKAAANSKTRAEEHFSCHGPVHAAIQDPHLAVAYLRVQFHTLRTAFPSKYGAMGVLRRHTCSWEATGGHAGARRIAATQ